MKRPSASAQGRWGSCRNAWIDVEPIKEHSCHPPQLTQRVKWNARPVLSSIGWMPGHRIEDLVQSRLLPNRQSHKEEWGVHPPSCTLGGYALRRVVSGPRRSRESNGRCLAPGEKKRPTRVASFCPSFPFGGSFFFCFPRLVRSERPSFGTSRKAGSCLVLVTRQSLCAASAVRCAVRNEGLRPFTNHGFLSCNWVAPRGPGYLWMIFHHRPRRIHRQPNGEV